MADLLSLRYLPISKAELFDGNAKLHNLDQIIQSIARYGFKSACKWESTLNDGRGGIVAGNGRVEALREMERRGDELPIGIVQDTETGEWCVPVLFGVEADSEAIARAYALDDNNLTLLGGDFAVADLMKLYDQELLMTELEELSQYDEIPVSIGEDNLEELLSQLASSRSDEPEPEYGEDDPTVPEGIQVREGVELGSIWALGRHRIMCGDSTVEANVRVLLGDKDKFEMIFTDPPYGVGYSGGHFHSGDVNIRRDREKLANDENTAIYTHSIPIMAKFCDGPIYTWFASTKALELYQAISLVKGEIHAMIVWHKINATYAAMNAQYKQRHEPCLYWKPKGSTLRWIGESTESTLWEIKKDGVNNYHPTQKPTELAKKAMGNHSANLIGDFFLGSGSTIIAAQEIGDTHTVFGIELSPDYIEVILQRWETFTGIPAKRIN